LKWNYHSLIQPAKRWSQYYIVDYVVIVFGGDIWLVMHFYTDQGATGKRYIVFVLRLQLKLITFFHIKNMDSIYENLVRYFLNVLNFEKADIKTWRSNIFKVFLISKTFPFLCLFFCKLRTLSKYPDFLWLHIA